MDDTSTPHNGATHSDYLQQLWRENLNRPQIGIHEDFFEAGGSSMQVVEMLMTVTSKFGREIDYEEFFREPCIRKLDELLQG